MNALTIYTESPGGCRKRKREYYNFESAKPKISETTKTNLDGNLNGILNEAFTSSTPNKNFVRTSIRRSARRTQLQSSNKENFQLDCMEVKSIAEIHLAKTIETSETDDVSENPFEVIRKPPKKKKKSEIEECCFENPALNLEAPERIFNPFEICRSTPPKDIKSTKESCFVNNGLDIRVEDNNINPYEIARTKSPIPNVNNGIENLALDVCSPKSIQHPTNVAIGLPFKPTINCRIDFHNAPLQDFLSSSECMNAVNLNSGNFKQSLPIIAEDEEIDIGKELDCYQLELENSINEAKLKKVNIETVKAKLNLIEEDSNEKISLKEINELDSSNNLSGIAPLSDDKHINLDENEPTELELDNKKIEISVKDKSIEQKTINTSQIATPEICVKSKSDLEDEHNESRETSECESDLGEEPTPFVRCYRKPVINISTESKKLAEKPDIIPDKEGIKETKSKIGTAIRRSIRRLIIHPNKKHPNEKVTNLNDIKEENEPTKNNIFQSIRQSLRRKPPKAEQFKNEFQLKNKQNEISIIDCTERTKIFRSPKSKTEAKDVKVEKLKNIFSKNKYNF